MRIVSFVFLIMLYQSSFAAADYVREKKWADEIVPGIVVGDPVYLALGQGHKFLGIFTEGKDAKAGLIVVHGLGIHPDWNMVGTLRAQLAEHGYSTLSIQMPVLSSDANAEAYEGLFPEAADRISVAVDFLQARGYKRIAIVSHSMGSAMSRLYVVNNQAKLLAWASLGLGHGYAYDHIDIPVLDMYGEHDLPPIMQMAASRGASLRGKLSSRQVRVPNSDHFYTNHEEEMVREVESFLDSLK